MKLTVKYNNKTVGYLAELKNGDVAFEYDKEWIRNGFSISPLSLPLTSKIYINKKNNFDGLYGVFWDSLPDGWGELLVRRMLNKLGIDFDSLSPLQRLSIISKNGLGALEYEPSKDLNPKIKEYDLDQLSELSNEILNDNPSNDLDTIYNYGGSSGGARPKAHLTIDNEEWIVKFPCKMDPTNIGEKEYQANKLAKKCGININECKLFKSNVCSGYFGAKRFDRNNGLKIHTISLCAILETSHRIPNLDYGYLFKVIQTISNNKDDLYEAFKRMCFNVYYKNKDDHGKNFSFIYDEDTRTYRLSPAYDLTSTPYKFEHEMTINNNGNPCDEDLLTIAKDFKLSQEKCMKIMNEIKNKINLSTN